MSIKVVIFQTDNRTDSDYVGLCKLVNTRRVEYLQKAEHLQGIEYRYEYMHMEPKYYENMHPANGKIYIMDEILSTFKDDIIVFLDSDAWIQNPDYLHDLLLLLINSGSDIHGCYSRDPYVLKNTYINSGSFILKINDFTRSIYKEIIEFLKSDPKHHKEWMYDQYYVSQIIYNYKEKFLVFIPETISTPYGRIIRHNWYKTHKMYRDMYDILDNPYTRPKEPFDFDGHRDPKPWPNKDEVGHEFWA